MVIPGSVLPTSQAKPLHMQQRGPHGAERSYDRCAYGYGYWVFGCVLHTLNA
ncbi:hypothetical protein LY41_000718 [Prauserella halophila]|nr:hypothetical protein [Prauserella halophila]